MNNANRFEIINLETKMLYQKLIGNPSISGEIEYDNNSIKWNRGGETVLFLDGDTVSVSVKRRLFSHTYLHQITHWHDPDYEELCKLGEKDNIMVIRCFLGVSGIIYTGSKDDYMHNTRLQRKWGKKYIF